MLGAEGIARTLAALREYAAVARRHQAQDRRHRDGGAAAGARTRRRSSTRPPRFSGAPIEVIDGAREAALTFRAVADAFPDALAGALTVVDIGGGSTEIVIAAAGEVAFNVSLPLGSVRLTERFIRHDPPRPDEIAAITAAVDAALAAVPFPRPAPPRRPWSASRGR